MPKPELSQDKRIENSTTELRVHSVISEHSEMGQHLLQVLVGKAFFRLKDASEYLVIKVCNELLADVVDG